jgi:uncharacterized protein YjbJ (UPF0337 family)
LFTVRAAISSARLGDAPRCRALDFTCSYWRARFVPFLTPRGGMADLLRVRSMRTRLACMFPRSAADYASAGCGYPSRCNGPTVHRPTVYRANGGTGVEGDPMEGKADELKGRVKEAAGDLTDDERLQREGKTDQASGKLKQAFEDAKDKAEELVDKVKDKIDRK